MAKMKGETGEGPTIVNSFCLFVFFVFLLKQTDGYSVQRGVKCSITE